LCKTTGLWAALFRPASPEKSTRKNLEVFAGRKSKNKGTLIIQTGTGHTAATATKPGTMATGTEATTVDAARVKAPMQTGAGNTATDNTKAGQRQGSAATGTGSSASNESKKGGTPWWVYGLVAVLGGCEGR
jgi:hypothetical protein